MVDPSSIDPNTALGVGLAALASRDLLNRLVGPTADYVGGEIKGLIAKCNINLGRVLGHAVRKLGPKIDEPGAVNPRVLRQVWTEGAFVEDELTAEYFGGLLASARSPDGRDDRVLSLLSTVRDLSAYDLRLHHLIYSLIRAAGLGFTIPLRTAVDHEEATAHIPLSLYALVMNFQRPDAVACESAHQSLVALDKYDLIGPYNAPQVLRLSSGSLRVRPEAELSVNASHYGAKLFLWVHGHADKRIDQIFDPSIDLPSSADIRSAP